MQSWAWLRFIGQRSTGRAEMGCILWQRSTGCAELGLAAFYMTKKHRACKNGLLHFMAKEH